MKKTLFSVFFLTLLVGVSETFAAADGLSLTLRRYDVICDPDSLAYITTHSWRNISIQCALIITGDTLSDATIRLRGETSRTYPKKSYKINLDRDDRFEGRDKLNLISEWTDPTFVREFLAYDVFHRAGLPASRAWFTQVYFNGRYAGLYLDVEQIDEHYLDCVGLDADCAIFKADDNGTILKPGEIERGLWDRKTGDEDDFAPLQALIEWINRASDADFYDGLSRRFNILDLARVIAVNALIGNTSTYYHNYYLIRATGAEGRWLYLPWDMDATFKYARSYADPPYALCGQHSGGTNELVRRCWLDPTMRSEIFDVLNYLADSLFQHSFYRSRCDSLRELLYDAVASDTCNQYTLNDFLVLLDTIPLEIVRRSERLKTDISIPPYPFDLISAEPVAGAVKFTWTSASDDSTIKYTVYIDHSTLFNRDPMIISSGKDTSLAVNLAGPDTLFWRVSAQIPGSRWCNSLTIAAMLIVPAYVPPVDTLPESIDGQLTLIAEGGPYLIPRDFLIERNGELRIEPGAVVSVADSCWINVLGRLIIEGTPTDTFIFRPVTLEGSLSSIGISGEQAFFSASWMSFDFKSINWRPICVNEGTIRLNHCEFIGRDTDGVILRNADAEINASRFLFSEYCAIESSLGGRLILTDCDFFGSRIGSYHRESTLQTFIRMVDSPETASISNCRFFGGGYGIVLAHTAGVRITGCWFEDLGVGINAGSSRSVWLTNSIFNYCGYGFWGISSTISNNDFILCNFGVAAAYGDLSINNSVFWRCAQPFDSSYNYVFDQPEWGRYICRYCVVDPGERPPGEGNDGSGPRFTDPWNGDFTPQDDSPLLDAGDGDIAPKYDYYGAPRLDIPSVENRGRGRAAWTDIGAIERQQGGIQRPLQLALSTLESFPNPTNGRATVVFLVEVEGPVALTITDLTGRRLFRKNYDHLAAGEYREQWPEAEFTAAGIYFCQLQQAAGTVVWKMAVVR